MKRLFIILLLLSSFVYSETYKKIKLYITTPGQLKEITALGIPIEESFYDKQDNSLSLFVSESEFLKIKNTSVHHQVTIDDWQKHYSTRPAISSIQKSSSLKKIKDENNVEEFGYGSHAGFYTLEEVYNKLDTMHLKYPDIVSEKFQIGTSFEGRPMYAVKISDNHAIDEDEPELFYNAMIHAREPQAMMTVMYFMFYLIENYGIDDAVTYLVDNREFYFVPIINIDGYEYNRITSPEGGGMWRKNRNGDGIDLNRNFGFEWGYDDNGSSPNSGSETYRGTAPFSEPETKAIRDFCNGRKFKAALNYHTYGNYLISPWGYIYQETPDSGIFNTYSRGMTKYNEYTWGISGQVLYMVNGDSDDWMYGEQASKGKIISMTPEVGTEGFWPPIDRIFPLAQENLYPNLYLAWAVGGYAKASSITFNKENYDAGETALFNIKIKNIGLSPVDNVTVKIFTIGENGNIPDTTCNVGDLEHWMEKDLENISIKTNPSAITNLLAEVYTGNVLMSSDTFFIPTGHIEYLIHDSAENLDSLWISGNLSKWAVDDSYFFSQPSAYTSSLTKPYNNYDHSIITLNNTLDLSSAVNPILSFSTQYNIENDFDYGMVKVSTDAGVNWQNVGGRYSQEGGWQNTGPIYTGFQFEWVKETIDLSAFKSKDFALRFEFYSDSNEGYNGWYIDDISIYFRSFSPVKVDDGEAIITEFHLSQNFPNPFNPETNIEFRVANEGMVNLKVYDILGREVASLLNEEKPAGKYSVKFDGGKLSSGIYFYTLTSGGNIITKKMCLLK